ncbi:MAG: 4Fe-4S dicluster domain-containing protein [Bacteroidales bacterium]|nr:4Fe-4S dicluster domain-containing protein [Bacteroidales bacterium]MCF8349536.1 4Fe-4S dicluster domain-containing protein [Bacteroidales bacterium]MCF8375095.1 4Fe-4S dicluster domain-containing protein [Bacteroidales bacterium]MCF8400002.1 4Fe-4S dicluster domain-containing protein [Bacteroidales bacterium]
MKKNRNDHQMSKDKIKLPKHYREPEFSVDGLSDEEKAGKSSRRDFLKMLGFTVGYATLASSCEMPVRKAIPFLNKPEQMTPGEANFYASTFFDGNDYCSLLVKTREGRPIKIEGNRLSSVTKGGTTARVQASVLNLYDTSRLQHPLKNGEKTAWEEIDKKVPTQLNDLASEGKEITLLTSSLISPSTRQLIIDFKDKYPSANWVKYDPVSASAILEANRISFGTAVVPAYQFENADLIVGFNADFLGTWLSTVEYIKGYAKRRNLIDEKTMSRHHQFESMMSLTGSNADERYPIRPSEEQNLLLNLYNEIAEATGADIHPASPAKQNISGIAKELLNHKGKSLIVCGTNDTNNQLIVNAINYLLGNYGKTIDLNTPLYTRQAIDKEMDELVKRMNNGQVGALLVYQANPAYDYYDAEKFAEGTKKVGLTVSFADYHDETAQHATYVCPDSNYLESWNDAEPKAGHYSLGQPTIPKLFDTRQMQDSLLKWMDREEEYFSYIRKYWEKELFPRQEKHLVFESFWNKSLHDGVFEIKTETGEQPEFNASPLKAKNPQENGIELLLYESVAMGSGKFSNNPWLQELPDPLTKITWDNYLSVSPSYARKHKLKNEDLVRMNGKIELPVFIQPGIPENVMAIALGYGRQNAGKVGNGVGKNLYAFVEKENGTRRYHLDEVEIEKTGGTYPLASSQAYYEQEGRDIVRETTFDKWKKKPNSGNEIHEKIEKLHVTLYDKAEFPNFHWGLAINLNSCIGCSACEIACQAENNVAVIGKEEVRKRRIMHWIRIDSYYSEDEENPQVYHQPVMCQQCDNAPCENVCPVAATPHSNEGLNMMAYNRCIGTRYCMNNCPYRVRRFNWFEYVNNKKFPYNMESELGQMVLNPDVTVRSRGVVEKCTFCSQRIQHKKLAAKKEGRQLKEGDIKMACQEACPADAIVFGNLNNKDSEVYKAFKNPRNYHLLEQLHTLPSVGYLTRVRNKETKT